MWKKGWSSLDDATAVTLRVKQAIVEMGGFELNLQPQSGTLPVPNGRLQASSHDLKAILGQKCYAKHSLVDQLPPSTYMALDYPVVPSTCMYPEPDHPRSWTSPSGALGISAPDPRNIGGDGHTSLLDSSSV